MYVKVGGLILFPVPKAFDADASKLPWFGTLTVAAGEEGAVVDAEADELLADAGTGGAGRGVAYDVDTGGKPIKFEVETKAGWPIMPAMEFDLERRLSPEKVF